MKLYSVMRSETLSSYILTNSLSTSALRFSPFVSSTVCFFMAATLSLSPAFRMISKSLSSSSRTSFRPMLNSKAIHRCKACHSGYSALSIYQCLVRNYCNGNDHKVFCSDDSHYRQETSHSQHILQDPRKSLLCHLSASFCGKQSAPAHDRKHLWEL